MRAPFLIRHTAAAFFTTLLLAGAAEEYPVTLRDWTSRGFAPDLVTFTLPGGRVPDPMMHVIGPDGVPAPAQITMAGKDSATVSFIATLPADTQIVYRVRTGKISPAPAPGIVTTREKGSLVIANSLMAIRVPSPVAQTYDVPVAAKTLPAPILAFRSGRAAWCGAGTILTDRPVKAMRVTLACDGPVFADVRYELEFAGGGYYRATIRVCDRVPLAKITEEFDAGVLDGRDYWELDLTAGWAPDMMEIASATSGTGFEKDSIAPIATLGVTPEPVQSPWMIVPDSAWYSPRTMLGVFRETDRTANSNNYPLAGFVPLHKGDWRRSLGIEIHTPDSKQVRLRLPMTLRHASWLREVTSETSPFSVIQHENELPTTYGRRIWGLQLAHPLYADTGPARPGGKPRGPLALSRLQYGVISLDRYKDYILKWPDGKPQYPRVFLKPEQIPTLRKSVDQSPLATSLKKGYLATGDDEVARRKVKEVKLQLAQQARYMLSTPTVGHHAMGMGAYIKAAMAEDILSWPGLAAEDRQFIRSTLALIAYLFMEGDVISYANGAHTGPPNMGAAVSAGMSAYIAMLPDHPMYARWLSFADRYLQYKLGVAMAPGGGWFEYGGAYHMHGYARLNNGIQGLHAASVPGSDILQEYNRQDWLYYMNLLTPYDNRWQARIVPGMANSPPSMSGHFMEASGVLAAPFPETAANLRWAWLANGAGKNDLNENLERPWIQPKEPVLKSEIYPGVGIIFRADQGPDETYMFLRSGFNWSHWPEDQGHFILMSKGAMLVPYQPFQYGGSASKEFDMCNLLRFGSPSNRMAHSWTDANILDHAFGPTVDYAWSSVGYPDWYFNPGANPDFLQAQGISAIGTGSVRPLAAGFDQKPGAFDWNRQVLFLKSDNPKGANYFVFRDSIRAYNDTRLASWLYLDLLGRKTDVKTAGAHIAVDTEWPTKLDIVFAQKEPVTPDMMEQNMHIGPYGGGTTPVYFTNGQAISRNWRNGDGSAITNNKPAGLAEQHVILRVGKGPDEDYFWVVYPRGSEEKSPAVLRLAPAVAKITTSENTDYVFMSPTSISFLDDDVSFEGCAGSVRIGKDYITLALLGGSGKIGYKGHVLEGVAPFEKTIRRGDLKKRVTQAGSSAASIEYNPTLKDHRQLCTGVRKAEAQGAVEFIIDAGGGEVVARDGNVSIEGHHAAIAINPQGIRFVARTQSYCRLSVGNVGVRGVGPFDLTFTDTAIKGTVAGAIRTLVCTWPNKIVRPMYHMDGVRWYAGFADDHAISKGTAAPQFAIAFGVGGGIHGIAIEEWTYPALPPVPERIPVTR